MSRSVRSSTAPLRSQWLDTIDYMAAWQLQREHAEARADDPATGEDVVLLLEHPSVYTAGRRTTEPERPTDGTPVIDVDRGGKITWHGPGQLVGYPIIGLAEPYDVVDYVRRLEQALISVVSGLGVQCGRIAGRSGVWMAADDRNRHRKPDRKVAAIGVRVQRGVTLHGFALNCNPDLTAFDRIVPCGIADAGVTSLSAELGRDVTVAEVLPLVQQAIAATLDGELPVTDCDVRPTTEGRSRTIGHGRPTTRGSCRTIGHGRREDPVARGVTLALDPALTR